MTYQTSEPSNRPRVPRWVVLSAIGVAVLVIVVVVMMLVSGGEHGPGRHGGSDHPHTSVTHAPSTGHVPPSGAHG
ncbi:hypothetical protein [Nocardia sp. GTS18]|uniref:hypothetical protein n=1 Tax=Nocardia sp. GTS18 TaxID=1778064 RepID=UPI0015EEAD48|nr:hypothetical protein [Nocardia sp. GTS18]